MRGFVVVPMRSVGLLAVTLLVATAFAGCATDTSGASSSLEDAAKQINVQGSETTGIIRGVVVDTAIHPLAKVAVSVKAGAKNFVNLTNAEGAFGFGNLAPGTYFVSAVKSGYKTTQQSIEVKANDPEPGVAKILMEVDTSFQKPSHDTFHFRGYMECNVVVVFFFFPCEEPITGTKIGNDNWVASYPIAGNVSWLHTSMTWVPKQPVGTELYFNIGNPDTEIIGYKGGPSPLVLDIKEDKDLGQFKDNSVVIEVSGNGEQGLAGAEAEQDFDAYIVAFHGYKPPADYAFWKDGEPKDPK